MPPISPSVSENQIYGCKCPGTHKKKKNINVLWEGDSPKNLEQIEVFALRDMAAANRENMVLYPLDIVFKETKSYYKLLLLNTLPPFKSFASFPLPRLWLSLTGGSLTAS